MHGVSGADLAMRPTVPLSSGVCAVLSCCPPVACPQPCGAASVVFGGSMLSPASQLAEPRGDMGGTPGQDSAAAAATCAGTAKVIMGTQTAVSGGEV